MIRISEKVKGAHSRLSKSEIDFITLLTESNGGLIKKKYTNILQNNNAEINDLFNPWPLFISQGVQRSIQSANNAIIDLIKKIPKRIFNNCYNDIGSYYNILPNNVEYQLRNSSDEMLNNLIGRSDFIIDESGIKFLEFNMTTNVGGWETLRWENSYINNCIISSFIRKNDVKIRKCNLFEILFNHIENMSRDIICDTVSEINIFFGDYDYSLEATQYKATEMFFNQLYRCYLLERGGGRTGQVFMCDYGQIKIENDTLYQGNTKIHVVVELNRGRVPAEIVRLNKERKLALLNGPISNLMTNKLNLAVLSENCESDVFTGEEKETIRKHIPWTRKLRQIETIYKGKSGWLRDIVISKRDEMVIKKADGFGGNEVYLGKQQIPGEWNDLVDRTMSENGWMVQEYVESMPFLFQSGDEGCAEHNVVWGAMMCGHIYSGCYLRLMPKDGQISVINAHRGAESSIVIHVEE